jgi:hypothetical protein
MYTRQSAFATRTISPLHFATTQYWGLGIGNAREVCRLRVSFVARLGGGSEIGGTGSLTCFPSP